ncbi:hypothetical protein [Devosia sp.]|uniref:hypothetical protein n=1 Tax=Devosia sp. TaxID=1871048 RepID=UPI00262813E7|nr:hypothetical protein [Devosia sp.]
MKIMSACLAIIAAYSLAACTTQRASPTPTISLQAALIDTADSLNALRQRTASRDRFGLAVETVTVEFNVSSKATNTAKAGLSTKDTPLGVGGLLGIDASNEFVTDNSAGNKITIVLRNLATMDNSKANPDLYRDCRPGGNPANCSSVLGNGGRTVAQ